MIDVILGILDLPFIIAGGYALGRWHQHRVHVARNAAIAECVECPHKTAPKPLSMALSAAAGHKEATGHRVMIVAAAA